MAEDLQIECSNRTFMELKLAVTVLRIRKVVCSNRTFMELKFRQGARRTASFKVLIAPLWN